MSDLHRLIYYSRNRIPGDTPQIAQEIAKLLASSRRNNAASGITGALIFNSGIFAQVLEGKRGDIEATFERIQRDPRHGEVEVLAFAPEHKRGFSSWAMAFVGQSREGEAVFGHLGNLTGFEQKHMEGERIFRILHTIAIEEERHAARAPAATH